MRVRIASHRTPQGSKLGRPHSGGGRRSERGTATQAGDPMKGAWVETLFALDLVGILWLVYKVQPYIERWISG